MRTTLSLIFATLCGTCLTLTAQVFTGPHSLPSLNAQGIIVADVNHDGNADLIYTQSNANTVAVALSRGDGTFDTPATYFAGNAPGSLAVADFNGDGKLDLAITTPGSSNNLSEITVLLGNGDSTFQAPVTYTVGGVPNSITVGDFNNDGKPDLAVLSLNQQLTILTNTGTSFSAQTITVPTYYSQNGFGDQTWSVTAGDFNGDHRMDLAYVDGCGGCDIPVETYWIMTNTGSGWTFAQGPTATGTYLIHAFDLDLDGKSDLVSTYAGCHTPCEGTIVDYSNGDGTFTRVFAYGGGSLDPISFDAAMGDFNNDGKMDLAIIVSSGYGGPKYTYQSAGIAILDGKGGRSGFEAPRFFLYPPGDTSSVEGALIDSGFFEPNGNKDLFTPTFFTESAVSYWLNTTIPKHDPCPYPTSAGVHICAPAQNSTTNGERVTFLASARAGTQPLNRMELWIDGHKVFQVFADRMHESVKVTPGTHEADIIEDDATGAYIKKRVSFTVP